MPEHVVSQQHFTNTARKRSKVRLNDQLIPKPSDINMTEKMIKIATPKEHPYASHISRFAMFPSFHSPDDPDTGVRAASQPFLNPLIPTGAPDVTLLSKTIGGPYWHEILETPNRIRRKAAVWTGEHGFLNHAKPLKGDGQVFYPTPPNIVLPNPKLRDWNFTLSERTSNMLKNMERTHWVTSYQMHYTGSGPANPLKIDDFKEKMSDLTGMTSHAALLRERSYPVFVPSKPREGWRRRQGSHVGRSTCSPAVAILQSPSLALNQGTASATIHQQRPQEITAKHNEAPDPNQMGHSQSEYSSGSIEAMSTELSQEVLRKQKAKSKSSAYQGREKENCKVKFDESLMQESVSQRSQEANAAQIADTEKPVDLHNRESHAELLSRAASEEKKLPEGKELPRSISNPCILPRPPVLPGIRPVGRAGTVGRGGAALSLLDLQDSFSKSEAHRNFNSSSTRAAVNLRDNVVTGKKHDFYGINCFYLHG
ncbi:sperm-associated microtubule inner protein 4 [Thunnus thynnus]|uniref:sperm-associated microtubule inner protein 4 n=1 Tax=Thunnus thynnus TaxID=8237 RepID=UPI0035298CF1